MRRSYILLAAIISTLCFTSCEKEYTCRCYTTDPATGKTTFSDGHMRVTTTSMRPRKRAEETCKARTGGSNESCGLL